jgi:hypothetical protein
MFISLGEVMPKGRGLEGNTLKAGDECWKFLSGRLRFMRVRFYHTGSMGSSMFFMAAENLTRDVVGVVPCMWNCGVGLCSCCD